jgi:hypothetical protein
MIDSQKYQSALNLMQQFQVRERQYGRLVIRGWHHGGG